MYAPGEYEVHSAHVVRWVLSPGFAPVRQRVLGPPRDCNQKSKPARTRPAGNMSEAILRAGVFRGNETTTCVAVASQIPRQMVSSTTATSNLEASNFHPLVPSFCGMRAAGSADGIASAETVTSEPEVRAPAYGPFDGTMRQWAVVMVGGPCREYLSGPPGIRGRAQHVRVWGLRVRRPFHWDYGPAALLTADS